RRLLRVEDDLDGLGMPLVIPVGRVGDIAARVADAGRQHAWLPSDQVLHSPETPSGADCLVGCRVHVSDTSSVSSLVYENDGGGALFPPVISSPDDAGDAARRRSDVDGAEEAQVGV